MKNKKGNLFGFILNPKIIILIILMVIIFAVFTGLIIIRSPFSEEFFLTDKGNDCSNLDPPTQYRSGDNQARHIGENFTPSKALWTSEDNEHPHYSDFYKTCDAHNLRSPIVINQFWGGFS